MNEDQINMLSIPSRQKKILILMYKFGEGWIDESDLELKLEKLFIDKRHKPKQ